MSEQELYDLIKFNDNHESEVAIPNSIFEELNILVEQKKLKSQHIGFAYSYIFLQTYLCRYAIYDRRVLSVSEQKEILGYTPTNKTLDYIIKKNGILEKDINILQTSNDFPILAVWNDEHEIKELEISFTSDLIGLEDFRQQKGLTRNQSCKIPVFGFHLDYKEGYSKEDDFDGSFFIADNFTLLDFKVFAYCMANKELGCNAFYLYAYFKNQSFKFSGDFKATVKRITVETKLSNMTVQKYMDTMKSFNMITTTHNMEYFSLGWSEGERQASTHDVNEYYQFTVNKIEYDKMKVVDIQTHIQKMELKQEEENRYKLDINIKELPY